jgi:uncharacterized membrane protein YGL010W
LLAHYGTSHTHPTNELIHFIAIPLIMLSLVGLLYAAHPYLAYAFVLASMIYYARLSFMFLITMFTVSFAMLAIVQAMGEQRLGLCVGIFVVAWIFQFIGHKIEGKKPSFFEDIQYLWVGPLFVLSKLFIKLNIRW